MRRELAAAAGIAVVVAAPVVLAEDAEGVKHFRTGVRLFKDGNFAGALAEFEEANRLSPTASALQNMALCQKALFRYGEARATLVEMLKLYGSSLSPADVTVARETIAELDGLVTKVTLAIDPADATVTVDGKVIAGGAERTVDLSVGEHRVIAESPRFRRFDEQIKVAGAEKRIVVKLFGEMGDVTIIADDADSAIVIDGSMRGYGKWTGPLTAKERHVVHVFKPGYAPTIIEVQLEVGEQREVVAKLGERYRGFGAPPPTPFPYGKPKKEPRHGPYGFFTASYYTLTGDPDGFSTQAKNNDLRDGSYFGVRAGWLLVNNFGLEAMFEGGKHAVGPGCYPSIANQECPKPPPGELSVTYDLTGYRTGMLGRYITNGETWRFVGVGGVGLAIHRLRLGQSSESAAKALPSGSGTALNGFFFLEGGLEASAGRALIDLVFTFAIDGVSNLEIGGRRVYTEHRNATMAGVGIRAGYGVF